MHVEGRHWYAIGATGGACSCGYVPQGPDDPRVAYYMNQVSCEDCKAAVMRHIDRVSQAFRPEARA
jgi:hypothetical protein